MNKITPAIQNLARRLIALEAAAAPPHRPVASASLTCEKLRVPLTKLVGVAGFRSLMSRALAMAKAQVPSLEAVEVRLDGSLESTKEIERNEDPEGGVVVVVQLLGLLVTLIGEPLMLSLVRDAWPNASLSGIDAGSGEGS
jgi:hypothetical protein